MKNYNVTPEFKTQVTTLLNTKKFSAVFPFMNLINREGFTYNEQELNSIVQFVGEFPYNEVAEFFQILPSIVKEHGADTTQSSTTLEPAPESIEVI